MMLETQALDLYLRFADKSENQQTKDVLQRIGDEEKGHLAALANLRDKKT
jgi:rubrerythrin